MEKKKVISIIFLTLTFLLVTIQVYSVSSSCIGQVASENVKYTNANFGFNHDTLTINGIFDNATSIIEPVWFYVNLLVVVIFTPVAIIVPIVIINKRNQKGKMVTKTEDEDISKQPDVLADNENVVEEPKILGKEKSYMNTGQTLTRIGLLMFFIQNLSILVMYILFFVLIPTYSDPQTPITIIRIYLILFELDFVAGILIAVGLILISLEANKNKIFAYIAAGSWLAFIGLAIYPRIRMIIGFTGDLSSPENMSEYFNQLGEYLMSFYGTEIILQTFGHCFLAIALVYSTKFLIDNTQFTAKGIINSFGLMNYIVGGLMNVLLLLILTYALNMDEQLIASIGILYLIVLVIKLIAVPFVGLIAGIMGFKRMKPLTV
ncbi:MAG: hypothetical protein JXA54_08525 [Candidatus Heimdallarchaeota archaeon]|nr:hypothetical protein [Candidatus Heimdallarchaeota archaeon]